MKPEIIIAIAVWIMLLVLLGVLFARTARGMARLAALTRELAAYQAAIGDLRALAAAAADPLLARLDAIRRRSGDPVVTAALAVETSEAIRAAVADAQALRTPRPLADWSDAILGQLQRMERALDLIDHALSGLVEVRGPRELEIQTTLKRGALNLRHARDAIAAVADEVALLRPADLRSGALAPRAGRSGTLPVWTEGESDGREDRVSDPIM